MKYLPIILILLTSCNLKERNALERIMSISECGTIMIDDNE